MVQKGGKHLNTEISHILWDVHKVPIKKLLFQMYLFIWVASAEWIVVSVQATPATKVQRGDRALDAEGVSGPRSRESSQLPEVHTWWKEAVN